MTIELGLKQRGQSVVKEVNTVWGLFESWFEPARASGNYRTQDYYLLFLILAVGTWLRFWHLGNVGLHGDEDIMGLAARGLVAEGVPVLPSGMVYGRAPLHTYLLAGSILLFGDDEWSLRLPSAVIGSLCGIFSFLLGRRFLEPKLNLAFVALVMFLPSMIEVSQTARMYVFLIANLLVFGILLFRWEKTGTTTAMLLAFFALLLAIQFHKLAIFAAPLMLFPGLANRSWKQLSRGAIALATAVLFAELFDGFAHRYYPEASERLLLKAEESLTPLELLLQGHTLVAVAMAFGMFAVAVAIGMIRMDRWRAALPSTLLLAIGAACCAMLHYHIGAIALLFGAIFWVRARTGGNYRLLIVVAVIVTMMIVQYYVLLGTGAFPGRKIIGAFVGIPSIWPTLRLFALSPAGAVLQIAAVGLAAYQVALERKVPVSFLFFAMAVWAPLVALGVFSWDVGTRHTMGVLPFFLLTSLAGVSYLMQGRELGAYFRQNRLAASAAWIALVGALVNPVATWNAARNSYDNHPDHKGAAEFILSLGRDPSDLIVAEDDINQTYYLGSVDYRLQNIENAQKHSVLKGNILYGNYTGKPVIASGQQLISILDDAHPGNVYIIGEGQVTPDLSRRNRGNGIAEVLASDRLEGIYLGRDGKTRVWKLRRPQARAD